jgi:CheY-like chemotaxis protein
MKLNYTIKIVPLNPPDQQSTVNPSPRFILFGEDDQDDEDFLKELFADIDGSFLLQFVNNGRKLVSTLEAIPDESLPRLLVLDYNMPELNGAEILMTLQQNPRYDSLLKIIWSTSGSEIYKKRCLELGAHEYLIKPSNVNDLAGIVRHMVSLC